MIFAPYNEKRKRQTDENIYNVKDVVEEFIDDEYLSFRIPFSYENYVVFPVCFI